MHSKSVSFCLVEWDVVEVTAAKYCVRMLKALISFYRKVRKRESAVGDVADNWCG